MARGQKCQELSEMPSCQMQQMLLLQQMVSTLVFQPTVSDFPKWIGTTNFGPAADRTAGPLRPYGPDMLTK